MNMKKMLIGLVAAIPLLASPCRAAVNAYTVQKIVKAGTTTTIVNSGLLASDTQQFANNGRTFLHFAKTGANACTVTILAQATVQGLAVANQTISVPATTGDVFIGPFPVSVFNDAAGNVNFTLSEESGLSFSVLSL